MKRHLTTFFLLFIPLLYANAQMSDREKFLESYYLMDEKRFSEALPYLTELHETRPDNANLNYNIGVALLNSHDAKEKSKALEYFEKAVPFVSPNYTPYSPREKKAPVDAYYYYGLTLHADYQFDKAKESFEKFKTYINEKHYLYKDVDQRILMTDYAKEAVANPREVEITNLGDRLNSRYSEISPVVRIDESAIYYTSRRLRADSSNYGLVDPVDGMYYEDLYVAFKEEDGSWSEPRLLNISTSDHEATVNISVDGKTLFIYRGDKGDGSLYESHLLSDSAGYETWSKPELLGSDINSDAFESHVAISPDQETLYFVSDREEGLGGKDIFFCRKLPNKKWAAAQNIGNVVNTEYDEDGVFMHPDGKTLYFSSNGHPSMGGYDIFTSTKSDTGWSTPVNLGYPINSVDDDAFFVTTPDGKRAYFSSFKEGGFGDNDIYMLRLIDAEEIALTLYRGEFTYVNSNLPPAGAQVSITNNNTGELVGYYNPRQKDGQFSAILEPNNSYHFIYEADDYETYEEDIYVPSGASYQEIYKDIRLKPVRVTDGISRITTTNLSRAAVSGTLMVNDSTPADSINITLLDEQGNVLMSTQTDKSGSFLFKELDPSKTYLLKIGGDDKTNLRTHDLTIKNDRGENIPFDVIDDKTAIFVPSKFPYEFYGITARSLAGKITSGGKPVAGVKIRLEDNFNFLVALLETDENGEFSFDKLSLDNKYRLVFDGDFPDDTEIIITNEFGEELLFRKVSEGVYEYVQPNSTTKGNKVIGYSKSGGMALVGATVLLKDKDGNVVGETITDENGKFIFTNLDMDDEYSIEFEGSYDDLELVLENEFGERLRFENKGNGVFVYNPKASINSGSQLGGVVTKNGKPITNLNIKLEDIEGNLLQQQITDNNGSFTFKGLNLENGYRLIFDGDFPNDPDLILINEFGQELNFKRIGEGVFEYIPGKKSKLGSKINGSLTKDGKGFGGIPVKLLSKDGELYQETITDLEGSFSFSQLDLNSSYILQFEGDYPDDAILLITNDYGQELTFVKVGKGRYEYLPDGKAKGGSSINGVATKDGKPLSEVKVNLRDSQGEILQSTITDDNGAFNFSQLSLDRRYEVEFEGDFPDDAELVFTNEYGEKLTFMKVRKGVYEFVPRPVGFALKSYTVDVKDKSAYKDTYPQPKELKDVIVYFQKYFPYNAKDINESNTEFLTFVNDISEIVERRGNAQIIITSSASKVPTKTWKANSILSKRRAYDTKELLEKVFKAKGLTEEQYNFVDINTLITGPEYKYDAVKNRSTYEKHQYVRIFIK